jgi:hypothetical protein
MNPLDVFVLVMAAGSFLALAGLLIYGARKAARMPRTKSD